MVQIQMYKKGVKSLREHKEFKKKINQKEMMRHIYEARKHLQMAKALQEDENLNEGKLKQGITAALAALSMLGGPKASAENFNMDNNKPSQEYIINTANMRCQEIADALMEIEDLSFNFKNKIKLQKTEKGYTIDYVYTSTGFSNNDKAYHKDFGDFQDVKVGMEKDETTITFLFQKGKIDFKLKEGNKASEPKIGDVIIYGNVNASQGQVSPYHNLSLASVGNENIHNAIAGGEVLRLQ